MAEQTTVEWLKHELHVRGPIGEELPIWIENLFEEAKQKEKEQIRIAYIHGTLNAHQFKTSEQYYNERYCQYSGLPSVQSYEEDNK